MPPRLHWRSRGEEAIGSFNNQRDIPEAEEHMLKTLQSVEVSNLIDDLDFEKSWEQICRRYLIILSLAERFQNRKRIKKILRSWCQTLRGLTEGGAIPSRLPSDSPLNATARDRGEEFSLDPVRVVHDLEGILRRL